MKKHVDIHITKSLCCMVEIDIVNQLSFSKIKTFSVFFLLPIFYFGQIKYAFLWFRSGRHRSVWLA